MITEKEVEQAIEECMREPVTGNKRAVLADLIIIQDYLFGEPARAQEAPQPPPMQSYSAPPMEQVETTVNYNSDTEFFQLANGMEYDRVWKIIAELMETFQVINPRLYAGVIKKLKS